MVSIPSLGSFGKSFLFLFATVLMAVSVRVLGEIGFFALVVSGIVGRTGAIAFFVLTMLVIPVLTYGYLHYFFFGHERKKYKWLITWDSLGEGCFMWLILVILVCIAFLFSWVISSYQDLVCSLFCSERDRLLGRQGVKFSDMSDELLLFFAGVCFVVSAYAYHWRSLVSQWWVSRKSNKADRKGSA